jgi:hypothetical protein
VSVRVGGPPASDPERQVAGETGEVVRQLAALLRLGFSVLNLSLSGDRDEQMRRIAEDVLPGVRQVAG